MITQSFICIDFSDTFNFKTEIASIINSLHMINHMQAISLSKF